MTNRPFLPPPGAALVHAYAALIAEIDHKISQLVSIGRPGGHRHCHPGCSDCCIAFSVLPLEAALLRGARAARRKQSAADRCIFLDEQKRCSLYDRRPILCRTQGMALAYLDEESQTLEISACPLNFPEEYTFAEDELLFMDDVNDRLAALNVKYCSQAGLQPDRRIALSAIPGIAT